MLTDLSGPSMGGSFAASLEQVQSIICLVKASLLFRDLIAAIASQSA